MSADHHHQHQPEPVTLALHAMATRFEIVLHGADAVALRAAGEEALREIERVEALLSLYRNTSEIAHLNARAAREPVRVSPEVLRLLEHAFRLTAETGGAFDITIAPLLRCWGFLGGTGKVPEPEAISAARALVGAHLVHLNPADFTVRFARDGAMLDLGAIGKGYAIEQAARILREDGITSAILHGGTSTVQAIGQPPGADSWNVAVECPATDHRPPSLLAVVPLRNEAMSVSAEWGRSFQSGARSYGHVLDPRSGEPANAALLSAVILPSATESDALSTALLTLGPAALRKITGLRAGSRGLVISGSLENPRVEAVGVEVRP